MVELCDGALVYRDYVYDDYGASDPTREATAPDAGSLSGTAGEDRYPADATADLTDLTLEIVDDQMGYEPVWGRDGDSGEVGEQDFHPWGRYQPYGICVPYRICVREPGEDPTGCSWRCTVVTPTTRRSSVRGDADAVRGRARRDRRGAARPGATA